MSKRLSKSIIPVVVSVLVATGFSGFYFLTNDKEIWAEDIKVKEMVVTQAEEVEELVSVPYEVDIISYSVSDVPSDASSNEGVLNSLSLDERVDEIITSKMYNQSLLSVNTKTKYQGESVKLTSKDRDILERLVMGESEGEGFIGQCLVAQSIRDAMLYKGYESANDVRIDLQYAGSIANPPNESVKRAVAFIFDEGGMAVNHRIIYFYNPAKVHSGFHESQKFVVEFGSHKFFDEKGLGY